MRGFAIPIAAPRGVEAWDVKSDRVGLQKETLAGLFIWPTTQLIQSISGDCWKMTADDFFLVSIAFGGFLIFALVLWSFARIADRNQENKRDPEIRPDVDSPGGANGHGKNEAGPAGIVRHRIDTYETVDAKA